MCLWYKKSRNQNAWLLLCYKKMNVIILFIIQILQDKKILKLVFCV